jgi:hypothetical protein
MEIQIKSPFGESGRATPKGEGASWQHSRARALPISFCTFAFHGRVSKAENRFGKAMFFPLIIAYYRLLSLIIAYYRLLSLIIAYREKKLFSPPQTL